MGYRWVVLGAYAVVAGASQMLWLNFAPILDTVERRYGVSELTASMLVLVFPLLYVVLSVPAGVLTDRKGWRFTIGLGALVMAAFSLLRMFDRFFATLLVAQIGIAVAQPLVVNGISKLVGDWFDRGRGALATGIGTMGMSIGMAIAMGATPPLLQRLGLRGAMGVFAAITVAGSAAFVLLARPGPNGAGARVAAAPAIRWRAILTDRRLLVVYAVSFLGLGFFNGLTTWLEGILAPNGIDSQQAGLVGAGLILGGVVGAIVIPTISDVVRRRKPLLFLCGAIAAVLLFPLCSVRHYPSVVALGGLMGFFFLPAFALLLEICAELAGEDQAGSATGVLMLAGNAGGVVISMAMPLVKGEGPTFDRAVWLLLAALATAVVAVLTLPETFAATARAHQRSSTSV
jgi:cyanate permease